MNYLITGGCGFIGTNFADLLLKRGDSVVILDNLSRKGTKENLNYLLNKYKNCSFQKADVRSDKNILADLISDVDCVYHLAAQVAVTTSVVNPRDDFEINAVGTFNVLEAIRQSKNKPIIIYSSTNKVYGGMEKIKVIEKEDRYVYKDYPNGIPERVTLDFHSPYGCSKGSADQYVRDYARIYGLKSVVMRQSCIYGTRQFGIEDQGWVAWFVIAAIFNKTITIYGNGKQVRDILYVEDLFNAWDLATKKIEKCSGSIFNVGGGAKNTLSLLNLIEYLEKKLGHKLSINWADWRPGDQPVYISDISKIEKEIKWEPQITEYSGIDRLFSWVIENEVSIKKVFNF